MNVGLLKKIIKKLLLLLKKIIKKLRYTYDIRHSLRIYDPVLHHKRKFQKCNN